jgi:replicative DNA helicase
MNIVLPNNIEAERAIFSIILLNPDLFIEIADELEIRDFSNEPNQEIWRGMINLYKRNDNIDIVSLKSEIRKQKMDVGPMMAELGQCFENSVIDSNLKSFVREVKNKSLLRQIVTTLSKYTDFSELNGVEAIEVLRDIERNVVSLSEQVKDDSAIDAEGIVNEIKKDMDKAGEWKGFSTGFNSLDSRTGGFLPTHTWIVGAYTGQGKSFFILQVILNILKQKAKVMLFSTEMDRKMNMLRLLGNLAGLGTIQILKRKTDENEKKKLQDAEKTLGAYKRNLIIYDNVYTTEEIRLKAKKQKIKAGLDIVIVDFIQNLRGPANIYERMSNVAVDLQQIAQELRVTIILVSQVTQASAGWKSKEVIEYKGAGEIAAVADVGLWIKRLPEDKSKRRIVLRKVRHGAPGRFDIRIDFPSGKVTEVDESVEDDYDKTKREIPF